jgi:hypothetical protein
VTFNPFDLPSQADIREASAKTLEERAKAVEACGDPIVQSFDRPSFRELLAEEKQQADAIAEYAAAVLFGVNSRDRLTNDRALDLEGAAMYLLRRIHPDWVKAAHEQAVETLLLSDEYRALMRDRGLAEARVLAHRLVASVRAALIGTLENETSVTPAVYLKLAAARTRAGAR